MRKGMMKVLSVAALVGSAGCLPTYEPSAPNANNPNQAPSGPETTAGTSTEPVAVRPAAPADQVADWLSAADAATLAERFQDEGPIEVASKNHACMKVKYDTIGTILKNLGVDMGTLPTPVGPADIGGVPYCESKYLVGSRAAFQPAKFLYCDSRLTLGQPQYEARLAESTSATTSSSTKLMDLFATAAKDVIANAPTSTQCKNNGAATPLFNADNTCTEAGISCLQGYPATADQVALCNRVVTHPDVEIPAGSDTTNKIELGKRLAVAVILSAAHSCE